MAERPHRLLVPPALHQDIEHAPVLIDSPPEIVPLTTNRRKDLIQMPRITRLRPAAPALIGILLGEFPAPFADGLIRHDNPTGKQQLCDVAIAQAEAKIQPHAVANNPRTEAVVFRAIGRSCGIHAAIMAHRPGAVPIARLS